MLKTTDSRKRDFPSSTLKTQCIVGSALALWALLVCFWVPDGQQAISPLKTVSASAVAAEPQAGQIRPEIQKLMAQSLGNHDTRPRVEALNRLALLYPGPQAAFACMDALREQDPEVRAEGIRCLGRLAYRPAIADLQRLAEAARSREVRELAGSIAKYIEGEPTDPSR